MPVRVGDGYAKMARVLDLVGVKDVLGGGREALDVGVEERVAQNDELRFVVVHVGESVFYNLVDDGLAAHGQ